MLAISRDVDLERLGRTLAALHQVEFAAPGPVDPWYWAPVGRPAFERYADLLAAAGAPFASALARTLPELAALESLLEAPGDPRMCHCDLWANNVRITPSGSICVLDWDNCGAADPAHELAMVIFEFGYVDADRCRAIYSAYVDAGGPARITRPEQLTKVIAQFGHFWELGARRWLDPDATDEERSHLSEWLAEMDDQPLTVDVCHRIVHAVGG
jgi:aminoglycoside phosphotransferase (APT) family kinase protein